MSKNKMDKYEVSKELDDKEIDIFKFSKENKYQLFLTIKYDNFDEENKELQQENVIKNAELVCRLLNENEERKNQPRIDKDE